MLKKNKKYDLGLINEKLKYLEIALEREKNLYSLAEIEKNEGDNVYVSVCYCYDIMYSEDGEEPVLRFFSLDCESVPLSSNIFDEETGEYRNVGEELEEILSKVGDYLYNIKNGGEYRNITEVIDESKYEGLWSISSLTSDEKLEKIKNKISELENKIEEELEKKRLALRIDSISFPLHNRFFRGTVFKAENMTDAEYLTKFFIKDDECPSLSDIKILENKEFPQYVFMRNDSFELSGEILSKEELFDKVDTELNKLCTEKERLLEIIA